MFTVIFLYTIYIFYVTFQNFQILTCTIGSCPPLDSLHQNIIQRNCSQPQKPDEFKSGVIVCQCIVTCFACTGHIVGLCMVAMWGGLAGRIKILL